MAANQETATRRKEVLTTGDVARICHVAPRTVSKWFDTGKLRGYRIPGSRDRRIPLRQLLTFMRAHGMPLEELEGAATRVLVVEAGNRHASAVAEGLSESDRYDVRRAANDFEAGVQAGKFQPHVILIDTLAEGIDAREILTNVRANPALAETRVVAAAGALTTGQRKALLRAGYDAVLAAPFDVADFVRAVEGPQGASP